MVDYVDGTVLAQLGNPDMRIRIAHALAWPDRFDSGAEPLNIFNVRHMDFEEANLERFRVAAGTRPLPRRTQRVEYRQWPMTPSEPEDSFTDIPVVISAHGSSSV
jgi:hypothetical protein